MPHVPFTPAAASNIRSVAPLNLPIGVRDFGKLIREGHTFVDKSLLIEEFLDSGAAATLIARPRRFGKTLNLSMLQHFFAARVCGLTTEGLFDGLRIADRPVVMAHQGRYPVIFFSFEDIKVESFEAFEGIFRVLVSNLYHEHTELLGSPRLTATDQGNIQALLAKKARLSELVCALRLLSELLSKHYRQRVIILLDEYDTPSQAAYTHGFYEPVNRFMSNLLGAALKDNPYLFKSVMTGVLQISNENLFASLHNIKAYTVLNEGYSIHFGFTEAEVSGLLQATGLATQQPANGYRIGPHVIYNPGSIVSGLKQGGDLWHHWVNTSDNALLKKLTAQAGVDFKVGFETLLRGDSVTEAIVPNLTFEDLNGNSTALWSLLLFKGYLTALQVQHTGSETQCELAIPNPEIRFLYEDIVRQWFTEQMSPEGYRSFLHSLVTGDIADFEARLQEYLLESASLFDTKGRHPEKFYHGLVLGLVAGLRGTHIILSNREGGRGGGTGADPRPALPSRTGAASGEDDSGPRPGVRRQGHGIGL